MDNTTTQEQVKDAPASTAGAATASGRTRTTLTKPIPTDRIAFEKQVTILKSFAAVHTSNEGRPVTSEEAGKLLNPAFSGSTVDQGISFFTSIGLLTRSDKGGFIPCQELIEYNKACQWDESEARLKLRTVFERAWFYRCLVPRLQLASQSQATCLALLANESGAQPDHQKQLLHILSFLELGSVISTAGGNVALLHHGPRTTGVDVNTGSSESKTVNTTSGNHSKDDPEALFLYLDKDRRRKVTLQAPLELSTAEYDRICAWIKVALIVEPAQGGGKPA